MFEKVVLWMAAIRIFSGLCEITAALFMLRFNTVEKALVVNSLLAFVGPLVLLTTMSIGLVGISYKVSFAKLIWLLIGVGCILFSLKK
ncbi:YqhV family protein [Fictibacillus sp. Mic-4]|uniref:YqhV family protein n=1 Tax=Fictibacillus TaxID=1329200 RepID=UPI00047B74AF|nr:YqhV family protein [Fictibacillus gelatini]